MRGLSPSTAAAPALVAGAVFVSLVSAQSASAGALTIANGERLQGRMQAIADGRLVFETRFGVSPVVLADVATYRSDGPVLLDLTSGERLVAAEFSGNATGFEARTRFGILSGKWSEVAAASEVDRSARNPAPEQKPPRNEVTISLGHMANQTSTLVGFQRTRLTSVQVSYSRSLGDSVSVSAALPIYYSEGRLTDLGVNERDRQAGIGDLELGLTRVFHGRGGWPHLQARLALGLPTGPAGGPEERSLAGFSSGNWSLGAQLGVQKNLGDGALLASVGYTRYAPGGGRESNGEAAWALGYQLNAGQVWSLSSVVAGSVARSGGQQTEPAYLMLSASYQSQDGLTVTPSFAHGLNVDAQDYQVGLAVSRRW